MSGGPHHVRCARRALALVCLVAAVGLGACATADEPPRPSSTAGATVGPSDTTPLPEVDLTDELLVIDDVRPIPAFGFDTREQPVLDPQQFTLGTLRGPCGASVETPFEESGAFRVFRSTISLIVEAIAEPGADAADAFVAELRADAEPDCPAFVEQLGSAEASTISLQSMLDLDALGDGWIGWTQAVAASTGPVGFRTILVAAEGDRLWLLAVLSPDPVPADEIVALGQVASARARAG